MMRQSLMRRHPSSDPFAGLAPFFGRNLVAPLLEGWLEEGFGRQGWMPPVDVRETEEAFVVTAELPGLKKEDIDITVENNLVTLSGERRWEDEENRDTYHRIERAYGRFSRSFTLPKSVMADQVDASFTDGVLQVTIPKAAEARPRRIAIH